MKFRPSRMAAIVAAAFPCFAIAEAALTLDSVVVTGSRVEHSSFDLPAAIDVVGADRIGADQARVNASEALAAVPGIVVQDRQNYSQDLQISSRGFGARSAFGVRGIRLISDGIPASMPDGQGQAATFNLDRAERIEVMRGPLSAIYGNHAGGVIQMFTPDGKGRPTIEGNFVAGSYGTWKADLSAQGEVDGAGYVIDASRFATEGYRDHSATERDQSMAKLTFRPSQDGKLTLIANTFRQDSGDPQALNWADYQANPRGVFSGVLNFNTRKSIEHTQGGVTYEHRFGDNTLQLSTYAGQRSTIQYQSTPPSVQRSQVGHSGGVVDFDRDFAGVSGRWIGRLEVAGGKLTTTLGVDYEQATDDRRGYENFIGVGDTCRVDVTCGVKGALRRNEQDRVFSFDQFMQAEWQGERWVFSGGVRHSRIAFKVQDEFLGNGDNSGSVSFDKTTPTVAAMLRLSDTVNLYASAARGFEAPTFPEMFYSDPAGPLAGAMNLGLKPSNSTQYEVGLKAFVGADSRLDIALFKVKTDNEVVVDASADGRTWYKNAGPTTREGLEAAFESRWANNISTRVAYTYLDAQYDESFGAVNAGNKLPGVAENYLFADLAWSHPASGIHAAVEGIGRSKVYTADSNSASAPGYAIANLRVGIDRQLGALKLGTFLRLNNIFDHQYVGAVVVGDANGRFYQAAPGFNWLAGISARYAF